MSSGTGQRQRIRKTLREAFGDHCYWCAGKMQFAELGVKHVNIEEMATIEHHLAKEKGDITQLLYLRLAHKRCNV